MLISKGESKSFSIACLVSFSDSNALSVGIGKTHSLGGGKAYPRWDIGGI